MQWLRTVVGLAAGGGMVYANGADWKHVLAALLVASVGVVSHLTSPDRL